MEVLVYADVWKRRLLGSARSYEETKRCARVAGGGSVYLTERVFDDGVGRH